MTIENFVLGLPREKVKSLVDFVAKYCKYADVTTIAIYRRLPGSKAFGHASIKNGRTEVEVKLSNAVAFPHTSQVIAEIPPVTFNNWEEEFVCVLAHELRHIGQFIEQRYRVSEAHAAEIDAEKHAIKVLKAFRMSQEQELSIAA